MPALRRLIKENKTMKEYKHSILQKKISEINSKLSDTVNLFNVSKTNYVKTSLLTEIGELYVNRKDLKNQYKNLTTPESFTRINSDSYGNPRYVCHFLTFIHKSEMSPLSIPDQYSLAVKRSHKFGGRKYHNKKYGGGLVFQEYNIHDLCEAINNYMEEK